MFLTPPNEWGCSHLLSNRFAFIIQKCHDVTHNRRTHSFVCNNWVDITILSATYVYEKYLCDLSSLVVQVKQLDVIIWDESVDCVFWSVTSPKPIHLTCSQDVVHLIRFFIYFFFRHEMPFVKKTHKLALNRIHVTLIECNKFGL